MADFAISLAEKLVEVFATEAIKVVCEMWNYKKELEELKETVSTIHNVLLDADAKLDDLNHEQQDYIKKLKDAIYDADDLFDEFLTLADELKQGGSLSKHGKFFEKVRRFFSSSKNEVGVAYKMSQDVKKIKERLVNIADNHQKFKFSIDYYKPIIRRSAETCSYIINDNEIIGREEDKKAIVDMLLNNPNNNNKDDFCAVTVVGVGGLGKTALAQLVYNDERIKKEYLRLWVCVSDQEGEPFDVKTILSKILELLDGDKKFDSSSTMEMVQHKFQQKLRGMKYLLVLDDIWNEDREKWLHLKRFLMIGQGGSRVVVTTRSKRTGAIIDEKHAYELKGLSRENSWLLFEMSAFDKGDQKLENYQEFVKIGKKIVKKCYNNPLAIKVVGTLLFGQRSISKWKSLEDSGLADIDENVDRKILSILKLSYYNLAPSLKNCFSYCAVFPKDFTIKKQQLIALWIAQGFIIPLYGGQDIEEAAEEHFLILLWRCFFQDGVKDAYDNMDTVKIHDLMHDVAQEVGNDEMCVVTSIANTLRDKIRHVQYVSDSSLMIPSGSSKLRSLFSRDDGLRTIRNCVIGSQLDNWICLRVLDVTNMGLKQLPDSIGNLLHLRYLDLSRNDVEVLPSGITRLHNLQTLLLNWCILRELPKHFSKLVKLRHLDLTNCDKLTRMPSRMDKLTSLKVLPYFVVGRDKTSPEDGLNVLKALTGIRGEMRIVIGGYYRPQVEQGMNVRGGLGEYLESMKHLSKVSIKFEFRGSRDNAEAVLDHLEPPSYVNELLISSYRGTTIPRWGRAVENWAFSFKHLVYINLFECKNLEEMPALSKLPLLKSLHLHSLVKLEYMEKAMEITSSESDTKLAGSDTFFFPSLEELHISRFQKLKGWWQENSPGVVRRLTFACLSNLMIYDCPDLKAHLICPRLENLELRKINEGLEVTVSTSKGTEDNTAGNSSQGDVKLQELIIDNMGHLNSLPIKCLTTLKISGNHKVGGLIKVGELESSHVSEVFASSLGTLETERMNTLTTLCGATGLQSFTALKHLSLGFIPILRFVDHNLFFSGAEGEKERHEEDEFNACCFPTNLLSLEFLFLGKMKSLPKGMQYLTTLQTLHIKSCEELEALPEWMSCLSSLKTLDILHCPALKSLPQAIQKLISIQILYIVNCPKLEERCKEPDGEDRPKIQHIPNIFIKK